MGKKKELEVEFTCPLGSECEEIRDNKIYRCMWYTKVAGLDSNTGDIVDDWSCAISWMPMLQVEMSATNRSQSSALESWRNEQVKGQKEFNKIMSSNIKGKLT